MTSAPSHFLSTQIAQDLAAGRHQQIVTRFPPEPNGYLHIGHAKSISLNFGLAQQYAGVCHLRFDDTNPEKEEQRYIDSIQEDIRWLGYTWQGPVRYTSDYFEQLYQWACQLIEQGDAYVCDLNADQAREYRGTLTQPGRNSPYRGRSVADNLALFRAMQQGQFAEGHCALRAKIDMAAANINLRDPILYRIRHRSHHQTGDRWCIYPSYDFAHGQSDAIEGITHSICTLEFEDHRPLYDWLLQRLGLERPPQQYEFARLNLNYTVTSKRKLKRLVDEGHVCGWDDPRMPTISGLRRRGIPAAAIRQFCADIGTSRSLSVVDLGMFDAVVRDHLNQHAPRAMAVLQPLKLVLTNLDEQYLHWLNVDNHPCKPDLGSRQMPLTRELYMDRDDFSEDSSLSRKQFKRLVLGDWVRLRHAYIIQAQQVIKNDQDEIIEVQAHCLQDSLGQDAPQGIRPRGVIHWVSASHGLPAQVRLYDRLFNHATPDQGDEDYLSHLNPNSLQCLEHCIVEPSLAQASAEHCVQFERQGYFTLDRYDSQAHALVFNQTIGLRDVWQRAGN